MTHLNTCLWLSPEDAPKAVELYTTLISNSRVVGDQHYTNDDQPGGSTRIWQLDLAGTRVHVMAASPAPEFTDAHSMWLVVDDQAELDRVWDGFLDQGGTEVMCGWITDPFGVKWQVVPKLWEEIAQGDDPERAQRAVEAVWQMVRIDVAALADAASA